MPQQAISDSPGAGFGAAPRVEVDPQTGGFTDRLIGDLNSFLTNLVTRLNGKLSLGSGTHAQRAGNLDAVTIQVVAPAVANTDFAVVHGLGRVVAGVVPIRKSAACDVYTGQGQQTSEIMTLRATVGGVTLTLLVW